MMIIDGELL